MKIYINRWKHTVSDFPIFEEEEDMYKYFEYYIDANYEPFEVYNWDDEKKEKIKLEFLEASTIPIEYDLKEGDICYIVSSKDTNFFSQIYTKKMVDKTNFIEDICSSKFTYIVEELSLVDNHLQKKRLN